jgi:hypothetical protein
VPTRPGYVLYYHIAASRVLLYRLRHERRQPSARAPLPPQASEAARRLALPGAEEVGVGRRRPRVGVDHGPQEQAVARRSRPTAGHAPLKRSARILTSK